MKKAFLFLVLSFQMVLQAQSVEPAPSDKAVVYFVRASGLGALINFTFFDSTEVIGRFNGPKYLRYECEPGEHLFWARSENKDFVRADLQAGQIYIIDVIPLMGAIKAGVRLVPVNSKNYQLKKIQKLIAKRPSEKFSEADLVRIGSQMRDVVNRGMGRATVLGDDIKSLNGTSFLPEEFIFIKKKDR